MYFRKYSAKYYKYEENLNFRSNEVSIFEYSIRKKFVYIDSHFPYHASARLCIWIILFIPINTKRKFLFFLLVSFRFVSRWAKNLLLSFCTSWRVDWNLVQVFLLLHFSFSISNEFLSRKHFYDSKLWTGRNFLLYFILYTILLHQNEFVSLLANFRWELFQNYWKQWDSFEITRVTSVFNRLRLLGIIISNNKSVVFFL